MSTKIQRTKAERRKDALIFLSMVLVLMVIVIVSGWVNKANAQESRPACATALVLMMDVSRSVDDEEYAAQKRGTVEAFKSESIAHLIESQPGGVAVMVVQWETAPTTSVPWRHLHSASDAAAFGDEIEKMERPPGLYTYTGKALKHSLAELARAPCVPEREVIDVSSDGVENGSVSMLKEATDDAKARGTIINAISIGDEFLYPNGEGGHLSEWLRNNVVTPGGFVVVADSYAEYGPAIRRKLVLELAESKP